MKEKSSMMISFKNKNTSPLKGEAAFFKGPKELREFLTLQKLEILSVISKFNPSSVYELAQLLERDTSAVQRDCTVLEANGFIDLKDSDSNRGSKMPCLKFEYNKITVQLPKLSYELSFKAAKRVE